MISSPVSADAASVLCLHALFVSMPYLRRRNGRSIHVGGGEISRSPAVRRPCKFRGVSWHGDVMLSLTTVFVSNGSTLNVTGSLENTNNSDTDRRRGHH